MILAILKDAATAESVLNNLSEQDFDLAQISLVMKDLQMRNKIADDAGPLKNVTAITLTTTLSTLKLNAVSISTIYDRVDKNAVLFAMNIDKKYENAVQETLKDNKAELIILM